MSFQKGESGNPAGRPKGAANKTTKAAKDVIAQAAESLGGAERLIAWAKEDPANERAFWATIYPKLLPLTVGGTGEDGEHLFRTLERRIIRPDDRPAD